MRAIAFALTLGFAGTALADGSVPHSLETWDNAARLGLPLWLKAWLGFLAISFLASLFFVRDRPAARAVAIGFAVSHVLVIGIEASEVTRLTTGLVSLTHAIGWTPALFVMLREPGRTEPMTHYGWWSRQMLFVLVAALIFDYRDAGMYLYYQLTGHPAL